MYQSNVDQKTTKTKTSYVSNIYIVSKWVVPATLNWEIQRPMALFMPYFDDLFPVHLIDNADAVRALKHPESIVNYWSELKRMHYIKTISHY